MTIHITPEPEFSYVSFETNVPAASYREIISRVLEAFNPRKFTITLFANQVLHAVLKVFNKFIYKFTEIFIFVGISSKGYTSRFASPHQDRRLASPRVAGVPVQELRSHLSLLQQVPKLRVYGRAVFCHSYQACEVSIWHSHHSPQSHSKN